MYYTEEYYKRRLKERMNEINEKIEERGRVDNIDFYEILGIDPSPGERTLFVRSDIPIGEIKSMLKDPGVRVHILQK